MSEPPRPAWQSRRLFRTLFVNLLLLLTGVTIALSVTEAALRVSGFTHFNPYIVDQTVGFSLRPYAEGWWRKEGVTYVTINSQGLRDREHALLKPPNTVRIAVLGDSFAEAFQVPMQDAFWAVMEQRLQACATAGRKAEVLNFGVSGFSTARELIVLRERVWQYSPDLILLLVTPRNDVRDNSPALDPFARTGLPYFVYRNGSLTLDDSRLQARNASLVFRLQQSFMGKALNWGRQHLRVLGLVDRAREGFQWRKRPAGENDGAQEPGLNDEVFRAGVNADWEEAWRVTEGLIVQMRDEVKARNADFLVVTGSTGIQVNPNAAARTQYMNRLGVNTLFYPEDRFKALGDREGFEVLALAPQLLDYATANHLVLHGSGATEGRGHWNGMGHRAVGNLIAEKLCRSRLLTNPASSPDRSAY